MVFTKKIGRLCRQNDVNLAKIRHVFGHTFLTDEMREHDLQIYFKYSSVSVSLSNKLLKSVHKVMLKTTEKLPITWTT